MVYADNLQCYVIVNPHTGVYIADTWPQLNLNIVRISDIQAFFVANKFCCKFETEIVYFHSRLIS